MKLLASVLVALAIPANAYTFGTFPGGTLFTLARAGSGACQTGRCGAPLADLMNLEDVMAIRRRRNRRNSMFKQAFQTNSPNYQIVDNDDIFQVQLDVPGVKVEDLNINLEDDGKMLTLSGSREKSENGYSYTSQFSQSFSLDSTVDIDQFSANLQNGVLVVSAPKDLKKLEEGVKSIPVTELPSKPTEIKSDSLETEKEEVTSSVSSDDIPVIPKEDPNPEADETIDLDAPTESDGKA